MIHIFHKYVTNLISEPVLLVFTKGSKCPSLVSTNGSTCLSYYCLQMVACVRLIIVYKW